MTLRELYWMALGKAEFLGGTSAAGSSEATMPYDPAVLASWG